MNSDVQEVVDSANALIAVAAFLKPERAAKVSAALGALVQSVIAEKRASLSEDAKALRSLQRSLPEKLMRDLPQVEQDLALEGLLDDGVPPPSPPAAPLVALPVQQQYAAAPASVAPSKPRAKAGKRADPVVDQKLPMRKRGKVEDTGEWSYDALPLITRIREVSVDGATGRTKVVIDASTGKRGRPRVTSFLVDVEALRVLDDDDNLQQNPNTLKRRRARFLGAVGDFYARRKTDDVYPAFLTVLESMKFSAHLAEKLRAGIEATELLNMHISGGEDDEDEHVAEHTKV